MQPTIHQLPFFDALSRSKRILLAGAGGGYDVFCALPVHLALRAMGKEVHIASYSFARLSRSNAANAAPCLYRVRAGSRISGDAYFPEQTYSAWWAQKGVDMEVWAFRDGGVRQLRDAYKYLARNYGLDTIILVDGGTDSLMRGDESGLGTPVEDATSLVGAVQSGITSQWLLNIGFGVDDFHGVSHYHYLENVAALTQAGGFLGTWQLLPAMQEAQDFLDLVHAANTVAPDRASIVCNSIAAAVRGEYGDVHSSSRTAGSTLWINPLMAAYWAFDLRKVVSHLHYAEAVKGTNSPAEVMAAINGYRSGLRTLRKPLGLPL